MTAQKPDKIIYIDEEYDIVAVSELIPFHPRDYGMRPRMSSTACWRGWWANYGFKDSIFVLRDLYIHQDESLLYPELNGVSVSPEEYKECVSYAYSESLDKCVEKTVKVPAYLGHRRYREVDLPIMHTGRILGGKDFNPEYYEHMGYQDAFGYGQLLEFFIEDGRLTDVVDQSSLADECRNTFGKQYILEREEDPNYVERRFNLDYREKAWWLNR